MKKVTILLVGILVLGVSSSFSAFGNNKKEAKHEVKVDIPKHSLIGLSSTGTITLEPTAPTVAGEGLNFDVESASDNTLFLQYSSITGGGANSISVSMSGQALPTGVSIELKAEQDAGKGKGQVGNPRGSAITLSGQSQEIISNIKSCYTGAEANAGHQLKYVLKLSSADQYGQLAAGSFTNTITYTITDN